MKSAYSRTTLARSVVAELAALGAEVLAHLGPERGAVDELDEAFAVGVLGVVEDPDVGGDAGVEEHVGRQRDDRLDQVVLQQPPADVGRAGLGGAVEQRRAVHDDAGPAAAVLGGAHLVARWSRNSICPSEVAGQARARSGRTGRLVTLARSTALATASSRRRTAGWTCRSRTGGP